MTAFNTVNKLKRRTTNELQGLTMSTIQSSYRESNSKIVMQNEARDTTNLNMFSKIARRTYSELDGLLIRIIESSNVVNSIKLNGFKLVVTIKKYYSKIKLLFKYKINNKY